MPPHRVQKQLKAATPRQNKTDRRQLNPTQRAFITGYIEGGGSQNSLAKSYPTSQPAVHKTLQRVKERVEQLQTNLFDPRVYENKERPKQPDLLTPEQRAQVVAIATANKEARESQSKAYAYKKTTTTSAGEEEEEYLDPQLEELGLPNFSSSYFESCMYEAGYARRKQGYKTELTEGQEKARKR